MSIKATLAILAPMSDRADQNRGSVEFQKACAQRDADVASLTNRNRESAEFGAALKRHGIDRKGMLIQSMDARLAAARTPA